LAGVARWLVAVVTAALVLSGSFKDLDALDLLPVDATLLLAAVVAVLVALRMLSDPVPRAAHTVIFGFLLLIPAAFFTAPTEYGTDKALRLFTITFLSMLAPVVLIRDRTDIRRHLLALAGIATIVVAVALIDPQPSSDYEGAPIATDSAGTIGLGTAAAVVVVIATMGMMWRAVPWQVALPAGAAAVYVLLQSGSRGPLFATVLAVLVGAFLVRARPGLGRALLFGSLVGVGILVAFSLAPLYSRDRIVDLLRGNTAGSVDSRVHLVGDALDVLDRNPLGVGWGGFQAEAFAGYRYPHNLPLEVLAEAGLLFGGIFLIWFALLVARAHRATVDSSGGTVFALLVCVLGGAMVSGDLNDNRLTFYVLGIAVAASSLLGLLAAAAVTMSTRPQYQADATIYLSARPVPGTDGRGDLAAERIPTYFQVVTGQRIATEVARALGPDVSPTEVAGRIIPTRAEETVLITATVTDPSPERAARIADLVAGLVVDVVADLERPSGSTGPPLVTAQVFEPAEVPREPVAPRPPVDLLLGALLGLLGGVAVALRRHPPGATATSRELIRTATGRPVLGVIATDPAVARTPLIVRHAPSGRTAEAFRRLRVALQHAQTGGRRGVWLLTSPSAGGGTTTIAANLAAVTADAGERVLVVDGNQVRPRCGETGLLAQLREDYDVVLVDGAPLGRIADVLPLARQADGVLLVVPHDEVDPHRLEAARELLHRAAAPLVGTVLTKVPADQRRRRAPDAGLDLPTGLDVTAAQHGEDVRTSR
jgi:capsular polysaccharide biosynthesis protein